MSILLVCFRHIHLVTKLRCKGYRRPKWISLPPLLKWSHHRPNQSCGFFVPITFYLYNMQSNIIIACFYKVSILHPKPCHIPLTYRHPIKKSDHIRCTCLKSCEWCYFINYWEPYVFLFLGPLHTWPKSRDHEIVRAQKKASKGPSQHTSKIM